MSAPTLDHLLPYDVELVRRSADSQNVDEYGNPLFTETTTVERAWLEPTGSREEADGAVQVTSYRLFLPPTAPLRGWDAVRMKDGTLLELQGDVQMRASPRTGVMHHLEAYLQVTE